MIRRTLQDDAPTLPPRPNLGPEPWPSVRFPSPWWLLLCLPVIALIVWRVRRSSKDKTLGPPTIEEVETPAALTPPERVVHLAETVRAGLVRTFGSSMAAYTTEELDHALPSQRIPLPRAEIIQLFRAADRVKFGDRLVEEAYLEEAESLSVTVLRDLAAGASSNQNGR